MAILVAIFMTIINILGAKTAAVLQTVLTVIIGGVGLLLIASSVITGDVANLEPQLFVGDSAFYSDQIRLQCGSGNTVLLYRF